MLYYLLSLTLLIMAVLLLRVCIRRHVPARLVYAMWLVVLIRMIMPISLFSIAFPAWSNPVSNESVSQPPVHTEIITDAVLPNIPLQTEEIQLPSIPDSDGLQTPPVKPSDAPATAPGTATVSPSPAPPDAIPPTNDLTVLPTKLNIPSLLYTVWFCGSIVTGLWFILSAFHFQKQLCHSRTYLRTVGKTRVYSTDDPYAPCLTGIPPTIYLSEDAVSKPLSSLVLIHEYTHLRHGDPLWSFCRVAAVCVFWWHPLIWITAHCAAQDAELACDEAVSAKLDDDLRIRYANIILNTVPQKRRTVTGLGSHPIKERIFRLAQNKHYRILPILLSMLTVFALLGCSLVTLTQTPSDHEAAYTENKSENTDTASDPTTKEFPQPLSPAVGTSSLTWIDRSAIRDAGFAFQGLVIQTRQNDTRYLSFPLGSRYRICLFYDLDRRDTEHPFSHRYVRLMVVDITAGKSLCVETLDTEYAPSQISYLSENSCILYRISEEGKITNAFTVLVTDGVTSVTAYPDQAPDAFVKNTVYLVSQDSRYTVIREEHPLTGDGGITVYSEHRSKRILDALLFEEASAAGLSGDDALSAVVGYRPVGFLDNTRLVYNMIAYEGTKGWGIYDLSTDENIVYSERNASVLGVHEGNIYVQYGRGYGNAFERIDRISADGTAATVVSAGSHREDEVYLWNNGTWIQSIYRDTPDTPVHTSLPSDMIVVNDVAVDTMTLRVLSADMTETLLEFDIRADMSQFFWQERIFITKDCVIALMAIERYPEIPPEETIISAVVTGTAVGTVYVCESPIPSRGISVYSHNPESVPCYLHYVPVFPDGITPDTLYLYPYILPYHHDGFRMLCECMEHDRVRYFVMYADEALSEIGQMLCEREITHDEYIRLCTEAQNAAPSSALVDNAVPLS